MSSCERACVYRVFLAAMLALSVVALSAAPASAVGPFTLKKQWTAQTLGTDSVALPPNPDGAVGPTQVMVVTDGSFKLYDKSGNPSGSLNVTDAAFFASVSGGAPVGSPHVRYDRLSGRWFVTELTLTATSNRILLAVSSGSTLVNTASFSFYQFQHDLVGTTPNMDTGHYAANPSLGVDANALYVGVNEFTTSGGAVQNTTGYVINKASLLAGTLMVTAFRGLAVGAGAGPRTPIGVDNDDPTATEGYFIGTGNGSSDTLVIRRVSTPGGTPTISGNILLTVPNFSNGSYVITQGGGYPDIDRMFDARLFGATIERNKLTGVSSLWTAHDRNFYQIDNLTTTPTLTQSGTVQQGGTHNNIYSYWMPTVTANGAGHAAITLSFLFSVGYPLPDPPRIGSVVWGRLSSYSPGATVESVEELSGHYYNADSVSPQRWGAYARTVVDAADDQSIWTFYPYPNASLGWSISVAQIQGPPPPAIASVSPPAVGRGSNLAVTVNAAAVGYFDPGPGYANRISAAVTGGVLVNAVTFVDAWHVRLSLNTLGATTGVKTVTIVNPDGQQTETAAILTVRDGGTNATDFNGDGTADLTVFDPQAGTWNVSGVGQTGVGQVLRGSIPVPGDYNGDGKAEFATYQASRPFWATPLSVGLWIIQGGVGQVQWGQPGDIPVPGDYDGDGMTDVAVYRPSNGYWYVRNGVSVTWGQPGDIPVPADYDGDGQTDIAVWRPSTGTFSVHGITTQVWGRAGDVPVPADYDGDGKAEFAVYRLSSRYGGPWWYVMDVGSWTIGAVGDQPVPQDVNGDGQVDLVVYRPSTGTFYSYLWSSDTWQTTVMTPLQVPLGRPFGSYRGVAGDVDGDGRRDVSVFRPSDGRWWTLLSSGSYASQGWGGAPGDVPVAADYDGDGRMDPAVYAVTGTWWMLFSNGSYTPYLGPSWGLASDIPVVADIDGDGKSDVTVFRPSNGTWWTLLSSTGYATYRTWTWGMAGDTPIAGDVDGDGRADLTVYRPSTGIWWTLLSSTEYQTFQSHEWGIAGDVPVPGDYDGDGRMDIAMYRPSAGAWYVLVSTTDYANYFAATWGGVAGDVAVPGDYDGDGRADIAIYRPSDGMWWLLFSSSDYTTWQGVRWGTLPGDIPVPHR
jgi:hypothetical protein